MPGPQRPGELENCLVASARGFALERVCFGFGSGAFGARPAKRRQLAEPRLHSYKQSGSLAACPARRSRPGPDQDAPKAMSINSCIGSLSVTTRRLPRQGKKL